jgi:hypothetical protein
MSSPIHAQIKINPDGFTLGIKAGKKKHFTLPQVTLGGQFATQL